MFKSAVAKLAHSSTIPALAGNSDLRPLQEIIATEKLVLQSYVRAATLTTRIPSSKFPFLVYRDSAQTLLSPPKLCGHGPAVKARTSRCVRPPSYRLHITAKHGLPEHVLCMRDPVKSLDLVTHIFRFPHRERSGMPEGCSYQGGSARRDAPRQEIPCVQSRFRRQKTRQDEPGKQELVTTENPPCEPSRTDSRT